MRCSFPSQLVLAASLVLPSTAAADLPSAEDFQILYYTVDYETGEPRRNRLMTASDFERFVNRARCECGQEIWGRVVLRPGDYAGAQIETYVGDRCDEAQETSNPSLRPCARLLGSTGQAYREGLDLLFHPIWLARGVEDAQSIDEAVASGGCSTGSGDGGLWICVESNGVPGCQAEEFVVRGDRGENMPEGGGVHYDFDAPAVTVDDVRVQRGSEGQVLVEWTVESPGPGIGFRVLCADEHGEPVLEPSFERPSPTAPLLGTIYFTRGNLCGQDFFSHAEMLEPPSEPGEGISSLDWKYVCSGHVPFTGSRVRIQDAGAARQFLLVAYDVAGNPTIASDVLTTSSGDAGDGDPDFDDLELSDRGCDCRSGGHGPIGLAWLVMPWLWRLRRRRPAVA